MKKTKKILALALAAVMLMCTTVAATVAYLQDDDAVTNTFTVGNVTITLDEADVKTDGTYESTVDKRVEENKYHLIPGHSYIKDPIVHVDDDSENCYLFVKLENGLKDIIDDTTIENQMIANGWSLVDGKTNIYIHEDIAEGGDDVDVFATFKLKTDANVASYVNAEGKVEAKIVVTAYAIQADGFDATKTADMSKMLTALGL